MRAIALAIVLLALSGCMMLSPLTGTGCGSNFPGLLCDSGDPSASAPAPNPYDPDTKETKP